ncbi:Transposase-associated domain, partial [Arabidopsis thaliana x Arabidopsis arenosa]
MNMGMDKSWITKPRLSHDYIIGVKEFLDFAFSKIKVDMLKCPCQRCCLVKNKLRVDIEGDLMCHGFLSTYTNWYLHGEELDGQEQAVSSNHQPSIDQTEDPILNLLGDVFPSMHTTTPNVNAESVDFDGETDEFAYVAEDPLKEKKAFDELMSDCNQALYDGCQSFSKLSFILKLYHIKCFSRITDKGMSMIID